MDFTLRTIPTTSPSIIISVSKLSCSLMTLLEKVFTLARRIFGWCVDSVFSELAKSSSYSFYPGRNPVTLISMSLPSCKPDRRIICFAISIIFSGSPMSKTKTSPPFPIEPASRTKLHASGIVMK